MSPTSRRRSSAGGSWLRYPERPFGAGWRKTRSSRGLTAHGSSHETLALRGRPAGSLISTRESLKGRLWGWTNLCCRPMRRHPFRREFAAIPRFPPTADILHWVEHEYKRDGSLAYLAAW